MSLLHKGRPEKKTRATGGAGFLSVCSTLNLIIFRERS